MAKSSAPLQVVVEIELRSGARRGQRFYRLSRRVQLPPAFELSAALPIDGEGDGAVVLCLPCGSRLASDAKLYCDPEHPERGSRVELIGVEPAGIEAIEQYIDQRMSS
jgi:hypothetical protein